MNGETTNEEMGNTLSDNISLTISSPKNGAKLSSANIVITGKTSPNAEVFINDTEGRADANGNFSINMILDEGQNQIVIDANDEWGNVAEEVLIVTVESF